MGVPFRYGKLDADKLQTRDVSGVASRQLVALVHEVGLPCSLRELALSSGISPKILARIFGTRNTPCFQPFTSLMTADRLLCAIGAPHRLHELTIIPNTGLADAREIAKYEFVGSDGEREILTGTPEQREARAVELMALREALIGDELRAAVAYRTLQSQKRLARKKKAAALAA